MRNGPIQGFIKTIKSKVIIALTLACFALFLAWGVSKLAFNEMLTTVEHISEPSERLRMVNVISRKLGSLDQVQKNKAFNDPNNYRKLFNESEDLRSALDTLAALYSSDSVQLGRLATIRRLLTERDKQFMNYLKVRERLVNNKSFSEQVKNLNSIVARSTSQTDSTVLATVEKTSTTTIYPEGKPRSFFNKLFGKKKNDLNNSFRIVSQEKIKRDTIALSTEEQMAANLKESLRRIEQQQRQKNASFLNREAVLADINSKLVLQMVDVLGKVESEIVKQIKVSSKQARKVVETGINTISIIMLVFVLLTGVLLYFILTDIAHSSRYRNELELAKDEAEYHGRAKQRFLSNMSHEIRTPLQSIIGYTEIIRQQDRPARKDVDAIYHSAEHLLQIVNEVLDYNRIISGKFTFSNRLFSMRELLAEVLSVMRPQAELKELKLTSDFDIAGLSYINGDPFRLKQILYNLLGNAVKFTESGEIHLSVFYKRKGSDLHFTFAVRDTGVGISEEDSKKIFNEFEQAGSVVNALGKGMGTGLGLTIIKSLVEQQNGRMYVTSSPGKGSIFTVYLTFSISEELENTVSKLPARKIGIKDKVWVVDDDPLILDLCGIIFERNEIKSECFNSPNELLSANWDTEVKYVLMDIRMPGMTGIQLCRALKEKVGRDVKIFAITAQVLPDERIHLLQSGFDGLVMKPFREKELLAVFNNDKPIEGNVIGEIGLDISPLKKMTYGDGKQLQKVLQRFKTDCILDSMQVKENLLASNLNGLQLITHRLAGRIAQIGAKDLAGEFRVCELRLRGILELDENESEQLSVLLTKLDQLLVKIDKELQEIDYSIS